MHGKTVAIAEARANIALVKYWGKRDLELNLPAAGSLSLTLEPLTTRTTVQPASVDRVELNGEPARAGDAKRILQFLDLLAREGGLGERPPLHVASENAFPTAGGLASSASGFAALTVAGAAALGIEAPGRRLSEWARQGSGSAARSIFGGWVRMHEEGYAEPLSGIDLELGAVIAIVDASARKKVGSTDGMELTRRTSPYHGAWLEQVNEDLGTAEKALRQGDLQALAQVVEGNCLAMHADAMAARPGLIYWRPPTLEAIDAVRDLRASGVPVFFTIDAGPHVVAFAPLEHLPSVVEALEPLQGIRTLTASAGDGARVVTHGA